MALVESQLAQWTVHAKQVIAPVGQQQPQELLVSVGGHVELASLIVRAGRLQQSLQFGHANVVRNVILVNVPPLYVVVAVNGVLAKVFGGFLVIVLTDGCGGEERLHLARERLRRRVTQGGCGQA